MADVGGVSYRLDADTEKAIAGIRAIQAENSKAGQSFDSLDKRVKAFNDSLAQSGQKVTAAGNVINAYGQKNVKATEQLKKLNDEMRAASYQSQIAAGRQNVLNSKLNKTTKAFRAQNGALSNLSYQLQDVAVQAQMGTDAFVILGQQAPQALGSFGPGGAVLGAIVAVGAAILGVAVNSLTSAGAIDEFIKKLDELEDTKLADLEGQKQSTAINKLNKDLVDYEKQIKKLKKEESDLLEEEKKLIAQREDTKSKGFAGAVETIELNKITKELEANAIALQNLGDMQDKAKGKVDLLTGSTNINQEAIDGQVKSIQQLAEASGKTGTELAKYNKQLAIGSLEQKGATVAEIERASAAYDVIIALNEKADAEKKASDEARKAAKQAKENAKVDRAKKTVTSDLSSASPTFAIESEFQDDSAQLKTLYDANLISHEEYVAQKLMIDQSYEQSLMELQEERFRRESEGNAFLLDSIDALGAASTNALAGLLSGTMTAKEAMASLANTILNQAIGALVQMGIEQVKQALIADTVQASSTAKGIALQNAATAASVTQAAIVASAWAPASASVSLASYGANAVPANAAMIETHALSKALSVTGGKESGGSMTGGGLYNTGEQNKPEIYQTGKKQLMQIPGNGGRMFNQNQLSEIGGGGGMNITVVNEPGVVSVVIPQDEKNAIIRTSVSESVGRTQRDFTDSMTNKEGSYFKSTAQNWGQGKTSGRNV